jgi:hypothetical protein
VNLLPDHLYDLARQHQEVLLREAAEYRLAKQARPLRRPSASLRNRMAAVLHAVAVWVDDQTPLQPALLAQ